jgi:hypothetical protein
MRSTVLLSCGVLLAAAAITAASQATRPNSPTPIATADGTHDRVRVEVTELKRTSGETLSLRFTIVNDSNRGLQVSDVGIADGALITPADGASYTVGGVHVIDPVGKKKYFVARDSAGGCVCSQFGAIPGGGRANHWARFAAPPESVDRMTIVIPRFAPMDDVPVSR